MKYRKNLVIMIEKRKKMKLVKDILKGILIGIANIIPGVSGGTMAVSMGIYDKIISSITNLFSDFKRSVITLFPYFIGMGVGIVGLSFIIEFLFGNYPIQTNLLFIGLIIGGLPMLVKKVKGNSLGVPHAIAFILFFAVVVGLAFIGEKEGAAVVLKANPIGILKLFGVGVIASATMVIPGVSGSMILILMGYYYPIIEQINAFIKALISFDMPALLQGAGVLVPFGIGVVIGIFIIAKIIEMLLKNFESLTFCGIIGLIVASPIAILYMADLSRINLISVLTGIVALVVGWVVALKLGEE